MTNETRWGGLMARAWPTLVLFGLVACTAVSKPDPATTIVVDLESNPCANVHCAIGEICYSGACFSLVVNEDPCFGIQCPEDYACYQGACFSIGEPEESDPCVEVNCPDDHICHQGACFLVMVPVATSCPVSCQGVACPQGQVCWSGSCFNTVEAQQDPCFDVVCPQDQFCHQGACFAIFDG